MKKGNLGVTSPLVLGLLKHTKSADSLKSGSKVFNELGKGRPAITTHWFTFSIIVNNQRRAIFTLRTHVSWTLSSFILHNFFNTYYQFLIKNLCIMVALV